MSRLNLHVDECISEDGRSYYIELVLHDHADEVDGLIADYERELSKAGLLNVPFHMVDLLHAHGDYKGLEVKERKLLLSRFSALFRVLPVKCAVFDVLNGRHAEPDSLEHLIAKELGSFVVDNLAFFQRFDEVHVYYDGGKAEVKSAIQKALGEALAKGTVRFKGAVYRSRRLCQVADYACYLDYVHGQYARAAASETHDRFFGGWRNFKKGYYARLEDKRLK